ncbi:MAG: DUF1059 domain-containing protein [Candidatus Altiarchaeota archaeon]|nr:DUF1059 domain-containing protein [Candidatus Altiarchaeota archaeon]
MKTLTCKQLGGACDLEFHAETFEEMAELSKYHGMKMHGEGDKSHIDAMKDMMKLIEDPNNMQKWFSDKKQEFDKLPQDD